MSLPSNYKPSPLSFGSPRTTPFQRPSSPLSPSTTIRPTTPTSSPTKTHTPIQSPSKLQNVSTPPSIGGDWIPRGLSTTPSAIYPQQDMSPTRAANGAGIGMIGWSKMADSDALSKLPPAQVREMREAFQVLDRDSDGQVTREDVGDMLTNLGQDASPSSIGPFFPPPTSQTLTLPAFLSQLSTLISPLSSRTELLNAFAAFDDDDSGQIDVGDLRDALLHTSPEAGERAMTEREVEQVLGGFKGRRTFDRKGTGLGRGEVFRYGEFVGSVFGTGEGKEGEKVN